MPPLSVPADACPTTPLALAALLIWPAVVLISVFRVTTTVQTVAERFATSASEANTSLDDPADLDAAIPDDLVALAMTHSEPWAQEDTLKAMQERYAELRDWQKVRFAFGIGRLDEPGGAA